MDLMNLCPTTHRVCVSGTPGSVHRAAHEATADHARFALGFKFFFWLYFFISVGWKASFVVLTLAIHSHLGTKDEIKCL